MNICAASHVAMSSSTFALMSGPPPFMAHRGSGSSPDRSSPPALLHRAHLPASAPPPSAGGPVCQLGQQKPREIRHLDAPRLRQLFADLNQLLHFGAHGP